jgi:hypothetical protein
MSEAFNPAMLQPGDAILYFRHDFFDWIIALKTWTKVAHVEIYRGEQTSYASRNGIGVNAYPLRLDGVAAVMRPKQPLDLTAAGHWFEAHARGQPYDWMALLCFTLARRRGEKSKMFCSEFATRFYRAAGLAPFNPRWPADRVPPSFFLVSPAFEVIWTDRNWF